MTNYDFNLSITDVYTLATNDEHMKKSEDKLGCYHLKKSVKWCEFP